MTGKASWLVGALVFLGSFEGGAEAAIRRVNAGSTCSSGCDGSSWSLAYRKLGDALAAASNADEIWVAAATYYPDECSGCTNNSRTETFNISAPWVELYGGFAGTETSRSQRSFGCAGGVNAGKLCSSSADCPSSTCNNPTILSGDIDGDASLDSDNSYHVVTYSSQSVAAVLDGFIVKHGYANGTGVAQNQGGAVHIRKNSVCSGGTNHGNSCTASGDCPGGTCAAQLCIAGGPTLRNTIIENNYASDHGAVNDHGLSSTFGNCTFRGNVANNGAALRVEHGSATVTGCTFVDNDATVSGFSSPAGGAL